MRQEDVSQWVKDAQSAFNAASDLDSLKAARLAHSGDKAPISLASRGLGSLSPTHLLLWKVSNRQREEFQESAERLKR